MLRYDVVTLLTLSRFYADMNRESSADKHCPPFSRSLKQASLLRATSPFHVVGQRHFLHVRGVSSQYSSAAGSCSRKILGRRSLETLWRDRGVPSRYFPRQVSLRTLSSCEPFSCLGSMPEDVLVATATDGRRIGSHCTRNYFRRPPSTASPESSGKHCFAGSPGDSCFAGIIRQFLLRRTIRQVFGKCRSASVRGLRGRSPPHRISFTACLALRRPFSRDALTKAKSPCVSAAAGDLRRKRKANAFSRRTDTPAWLPAVDRIHASPSCPEARDSLGTLIPSSICGALR